jgi:hypothetical protein
LITGYTSSRIYPNFLPQDAILPAIVQDRISTIRLASLEDDPDWSEVRIQISAMATSISTVHTLSDNIRKVLYRYRGTAASVTINDCWPENESSLYYPDIEVHQLALDYMFRITETTG